MKDKNEWYDRPQRINNWYDLDVSNIVFIDENGSEESKTLKDKIIRNIPLTDDEKYFTLTACVFDKSSYSKASYKIQRLKYKYWRDGKYYDSKNKKANIINDIKTVKEYKEKYCSYGAKTFLLKKIK